MVDVFGDKKLSRIVNHVLFKLCLSKPVKLNLKIILQLLLGLEERVLIGKVALAPPLNEVHHELFTPVGEDGQEEVHLAIVFFLAYVAVDVVSPYLQLGVLHIDLQLLALQGPEDKLRSFVSLHQQHGLLDFIRLVDA